MEVEIQRILGEVHDLYFTIGRKERLLGLEIKSKRILKEKEEILIDFETEKQGNIVEECNLTCG